MSILKNLNGTTIYMTFHEAIDTVIRKNNRPMTSVEIALELNSTQLYTKKDGSDIKSSQVEARVGNYLKLFSIQGSLIGLKEGPLKVEDVKQPAIVITSQAGTKNSIKLSNPGLASKVLLNQKNTRPADAVDSIVPDLPGMYAIRIRNVHKLPKVYSNVLEERKHNLLYIGVAAKSLKHRLLERALRGKENGTFFGSMGAMLGFMPVKGSLISSSDQENFSFSPSDEAKIVKWINQNLRVNWICMDDGWDELESQLVLDQKPLMNIAKSPVAMPELIALREKCVAEALAE